MSFNIGDRIRLVNASEFDHSTLSKWLSDNRGRVFTVTRTNLDRVYFNESERLGYSLRSSRFVKVCIINIPKEET